MLELPPRDGDAFILFYTTHLLTVIRVLQRIGVRKADVPDIAQHVFLKVYDNLDKVPATRVHTWIEVICKQQAADHYRLYRNRFETPKPNVGAELPHGDDVHEQFERCEMEAIVKKVLESMDAPLREVLIRYEFHDESLESIAKSLGIVRNTVHARLVEAKRIFGIRAKKLMGEEHRASMLVPFFAAEALCEADLQTPAFVEELHASIWHGLVRELGGSARHPCSTFLAVKPPSPTSLGGNAGTLRRILESRGLVASASAVAGFVAALLWPRDIPAIAKHWPMAPPAIVVQNHESAQGLGNSESSPIAIAVVEPSAPISAKSIASQAASLPNVNVDRELRKLEEAREFIVKARFGEALAVLVRHQQEYPRSQFAMTRSRYMALAQEGRERVAGAMAITP